MDCPHCASTVEATWTEIASPSDGVVVYHVEWMTCPACDRGILKASAQDRGRRRRKDAERMLVPVAPSRPIAPGVPEPYASLFTEAARTVVDSPRASAALSRLCLKRLLEEVAGAPVGSLSEQLEWAITESEIPPPVRLPLHRIRAAGGILPLSPSSDRPDQLGEVVPSEAETNLDGLERLFSHFFPPSASPAR